MMWSLMPSSYHSPKGNAGMFIGCSRSARRRRVASEMQRSSMFHGAGSGPKASARSSARVGEVTASTMRASGTLSGLYVR